MSVFRMRKSRSSVLGVVGGLSVACTIALTSPGVQIARASDPVSVTAIPEAVGPASIDPVLVRRAAGLRAPSCSAASEAGVVDEAVAQELALMVQQEARRLSALSAPDPADTGHVVLNSRGYNYSRTRRGSAY